jgi:hypothetical protein
MLTLSRQNFPHRQNKDGSFDSICTRRYGTVATVAEEWELSCCESKHICDPVAVRRFSRGPVRPLVLCGWLCEAIGAKNLSELISA